ncbi:MAG: 30S ribosomal protein S2 [Bdellovibrionales bacterium]|nr:30S ribosomal protein S2 [Bdellovibrionales bacterium]
MSKISIKEMLEAGVHFGHQSDRWNPKMKPYIYTSKQGTHIIDLQQTLRYSTIALEFVKKLGSQGKKIVFVGTKTQAAPVVKAAAESCGQYFVVKRWLGGTLTNFATIKNSIDWLKKIDQMREKGQLDQFVKKEKLRIEKKYIKMDDFLEGIKELKEAPDAVFIIDTVKEKTAVLEARKLGLPVIGVVDTNANPELIDYPIPGNDDSIKAITLFCQAVADSYNEGKKDFKEQVSNEKYDNSSKEKTQTEEGGTGRKMVAAGMAEAVEIEEELESKKTETIDKATQEQLDKLKKQSEWTKK